MPHKKHDEKRAEKYAIPLYKEGEKHHKGHHEKHHGGYNIAKGYGRKNFLHNQIKVAGTQERT